MCRFGVLSRTLALLIRLAVAAPPSPEMLKEEAERLVAAAIMMGTVSAAVDHCRNLTPIDLRDLNKVIRTYALSPFPGARGPFHEARDRAARAIEADPEAACADIAATHPDLFRRKD